MPFDHGGTIYAAARKLGCRPSDILDLSASINPLGISTAVRAACIKALDEVHNYPDPSSTALVSALAAHHGLPPECIAIANGSTHIIHLLPSLIKGSRGMIVAPAFSEYAHGLVKAGWETTTHKLSPADGFRLDTDKLASQLLKERPDILFISTPGNPAGVLYCKEQIADILSLCRSTGTFLLVDEAFMDFCGEENSSKQLVVESGHGAVLRSMTKFYAIAGLRLGALFASSGISSLLRSALPPWEVNSIAQHAGVAALEDKNYAHETISNIENERKLLETSLAILPGIRVYNSSANYLLIELEMISAKILQERLLSNHNILVRDCSNFEGLSEMFIRIAVRSRAENERFLRALNEELNAR